MRTSAQQQMKKRGATTLKGCERSGNGFRFQLNIAALAVMMVMLVVGAVVLVGPVAGEAGINNLSGNDELTTDVSNIEGESQTVAFDIDEFDASSDERADRVVLEWDVDVAFDVEDDDVSFVDGDPDLELVVEEANDDDDRLVLEIEGDNTLEEDGGLTEGDTVEIVIDGLDFSDAEPGETTVDVGLFDSSDGEEERTVANSYADTTSAFSINAVTAITATADDVPTLADSSQTVSFTYDSIAEDELTDQIVLEWDSELDATLEADEEQVTLGQVRTEQDFGGNPIEVVDELDVDFEVSVDDENNRIVLDILDGPLEESADVEKEDIVAIEFDRSFDFNDTVPGEEAVTIELFENMETIAHTSDTGSFEVVEPESITEQETIEESGFYVVEQDIEVEDDNDDPAITIVSDDVRIVGEDGVEISGGGDGAAISAADQSNIVIEGLDIRWEGTNAISLEPISNSEISNINILGGGNEDNPGGAIYVFGGGIEGEFGEVNIRDVEINNWYGQGIYHERISGGGTIADVRVSNLEVDTFAGTGAGINVDTVDPVTIENSQLDAVTQGSEEEARNILVTGDGGSDLYNTEISASSVDGIDLRDGTDYEVIGLDAEFEDDETTGILTDATLDGDVTITDASIRSSAVGIEASGDSEFSLGVPAENENGDEVSGLTIEDTAEWALIGGTTDPITVENLELRDSDTNSVNLAFDIETDADGQLGINSADEPTESIDGLENANLLFEADAIEADGSLENVELAYSEDDIDGLEEDTLELWKIGADDDEWTPVSELGDEFELDTDENVLRGDITSFSTFEVFGEPTPQDDDDGGQGGGGGSSSTPTTDDDDDDEEVEEEDETDDETDDTTETIDDTESEPETEPEEAGVLSSIASSVSPTGAAAAGAAGVGLALLAASRYELLSVPQVSGAVGSAGRSIGHILAEPEQAAFVVDGVEINTDDGVIEAGETIVFDVSIKNEGDVSGTRTVTLTLEETEGSGILEIDPHTAVTETFEYDTSAGDAGKTLLFTVDCETDSTDVGVEIAGDGDAEANTTTETPMTDEQETPPKRTDEESKDEETVEADDDSKAGGDGEIDPEADGELSEGEVEDPEETGIDEDEIDDEEIDEGSTTGFFSGIWEQKGKILAYVAGGLLLLVGASNLEANPVGGALTIFLGVFAFPIVRAQLPTSVRVAISRYAKVLAVIVAAIASGVAFDVIPVDLITGLLP